MSAISDNLSPVTKTPISTENLATKASKSLTSYFNYATEPLEWMIQNRAGLALLSGKVILAYGASNTDDQENEELINHVRKNKTSNGWSVCLVPLYIGNQKITGVICKPPNFEESNKCILFHNSSGSSTAHYFQDFSFTQAPADIAEMRKLPIYLYDYRGSGLNKKATDYPTLSTLTIDGSRFLNHALNQYDEVEIWGNSLGGAIATITLAKRFEEHVIDPSKISLYLLDCFTTSVRVIWPNWQKSADTLGWIAGATLDVMTPMKILLERGVNITVLNHENDPVIPEKARLSEYAATLDYPNLKIITSPEKAHATLTSDMLEELNK